MEIRISKVANGFTVERIGRNHVYGHPENLNVAESFESLIRLLEKAFGQTAEEKTHPILSDSFSAHPWPFAAVERAYREASHFTEKDRDVSIALNEIKEHQNAAVSRHE